MADTANGGQSATSQSCIPNPIPPPPTSRRSSHSFRTTPDRNLAEVTETHSSPSYTSLHETAVLQSPGAVSNFSTDTTTTIDIPDELDDNNHAETIQNNDTNVQNTNYPPSYTGGSNLGSFSTSMTPPIYYPGELPPAYQVAAALPTYEEAELTKAGKLDGSQIPIHVQAIPGVTEVLSDTDDTTSGDTATHGNMRNNFGGRNSGGRTGRRGRQFPPGFTLLSFPSFGDGEWVEGNGGEAVEATSELLGNDFVFFTAFLTAFLFNWIGFLLLMCFCHTIAARYGALSGFGLSLAKWTLIVKNSTDLASADNSWLWWLITAFGMLVCMRAIFQYLHIKRTWARLSTSARERLFFFY